jgi:hypothetical protein
MYQFKSLDWLVLNGTLGQQHSVSKPVDDSGVVNVPQCLVRDTPDHQIAVQGTRQRVGGPSSGTLFPSCGNTVLRTGLEFFRLERSSTLEHISSGTWKREGLGIPEANLNLYATWVAGDCP